MAAEERFSLVVVLCGERRCLSRHGARSRAVDAHGGVRVQAKHIPTNMIVAMKIMEPDEGSFRFVCDVALRSKILTLSGPRTPPLTTNKRASRCCFADEELNDFANEIAVLRDCSHANIVNFVGAYKKGTEIFVSCLLARACLL